MNGAKKRCVCPRRLTSLIANTFARRSLIMTPAGCVTTRCLKEKTSALESAKAINQEEGPRGFFKGYPAVAGRQVSNWSSRR